MENDNKDFTTIKEKYPPNESQIRKYNNCPYSIWPESVETRKNCWNYTHVHIYENNKWIGGYVRNYHMLYDTFKPFIFNKKWYALCSKDYTGLDIIELPSCKFKNKRSHNSYGFCPVEVLPLDETLISNIDQDEKSIFISQNQLGKYALISGCVWGDDSNWKVELVTLDPENGLAEIDNDFFDYTPLPEDYNLLESVQYLNICDEIISVQIISTKHFSKSLTPKDG